MKRKLGGVVLATMIIGASLTGCITVTIPSDNKAVETEKTDNKNETLSKEVESTEIETEVAKEIEVTEAVGVVEETTEVVEETTEVVEDGGVNQYYKFAIDSPDDLIYHGEAILSGQRVYVFTDTTEEKLLISS